MKECVINKKDVCPHEKIYGRLCSTCKIPDIELERVQWYHYFCLNVPCYKDLSMDEQGQLVLAAIEISNKCSRHLTGIFNFNDLSSKRKKEIVLEIIKDMC